jgi:multidrug efflux pump subunit AcrB
MSAFRIILIFVAISFAGFALLPRIAVNLQPVKQSNVLQVSYELPEAAPEVVENQITARLENVFSQLSDIEKITSVSRYNSGNVTLHLNKHADLAYKKMEVAALIRQVYPQLPINSSFPVIYENVSGNRPVPLLVYAVAAPFSPDAIRRTIEQKIKSPLSLHRQVEEIKISGVNPLEIVVEYDQEKLLAHNLSRARVVELLQNHSKERYLGLYEGDAGQRLFIRTENDLQDLQAFEQLYLLPQVRLKDVAKVYVAEQEAQSYFRINGLNSVRLSVFPREKANTLVLAAALREQIAQIEKELPKGYQLVLEEDNTEKISEELNKIYYRTGLSVLILIGFILLAYFNVRYLAVLMSGVLINLLITCIFVYVLGIQIHLYSLAGLTISFGMIVDNAIVMLDHLRRKGNRHVFLAILGATFTTLAALLPVWLLPEEQRDNLIDFALIIIVNLSVSLLVALFYTPAAYQLLIGEKNGSKKEQGRTIAVRRMVRFQQWYYRFIRLLAMRRGWVNFLLVLAFGTPVFLLPPKIEGWTWYNDSIGSEWYQEYAKPYVNRALGGSIRLFYTNVYEGWGFRSLERKQLYVSAELPFGSTLEQMNEAVMRMEKYLSKIEDIEKFVSMVYSGTYASIIISFKPAYENSSLPLLVKSDIIARSIDWGGVGWSVWGVGDGFSNSVHDKIASFRVKMQGYNYPVLEQQAEKMAKRLLKHPRIQEVNTNELMNYTDKRAQQFVFELNNDALLDRGVSLFEVREGLEARSKSNAASLFVFHQQEQYPVRLREKKSEQYSVYQSQHAPIELRQRSGLLMKQIGDMRFEQTSPAIYKENRQYLRRIAFEYFGSSHFGSKYLDEVIKEMKTVMPLGYTVEVEGNNAYFGLGKSGRDYRLLVLLLLGIFIVTCILFESFRQPFLILLSTPLSYIGLFLAFAWGGFYFDQGGYAAFLLLSGLVVNAGIFVINDFNQFRRGNYNRNIIKAIMQKALPILMSIASTVLGLVPFLSEGDKEVFWFSFATGGISGLLASLLGLFIILPVWMWKTR